MVKAIDFESFEPGFEIRIRPISGGFDGFRALLIRKYHLRKRKESGLKDLPTYPRMCSNLVKKTYTWPQGSYYARSLRRTRPCAVRARVAVAGWAGRPPRTGDGRFLRPFGVFVAASASFCIRDARECDTATSESFQGKQRHGESCQAPCTAGPERCLRDACMHA